MGLMAGSMAAGGVRANCIPLIAEFSFVSHVQASSDAKQCPCSILEFFCSCYKENSFLVVREPRVSSEVIP